MEQALFSTPLGRAALGWSEAGLWALALPEESDLATLASLNHKRPPTSFGPTSAHARQRALQAMDAATLLLEGQAHDTRSFVLDTSGLPPFHLEVYQALRNVPPGCTTTYGALSASLGRPHGARAVGQALARNPWLLLVPCHRVLGSSGELGGFSAPGGPSTKAHLLALEKEATAAHRSAR